MDSFPTLESLGFPPRRSNHYADWVPIYLELMVGSGERLCVGVVAADANKVVVSPVLGIERLACVYGDQVDGFLFAIDVALRSTEKKVNQEGIRSLLHWSGTMDGLVFGPMRRGCGTSLDDVAKTGVMQCASLLLPSQRLVDADEHDLAASADSSSVRLENVIRNSVIAKRPDLETNFGWVFRTSEHARPTKIGFVGNRLAANFSILVPGRVKPHVDLAKAKLWDLTQLRAGNDTDLFPRRDDMEFELFLYRSHPEDPAYSERQMAVVKAAVLELEEEADKASIRCRPLDSPLKIAEILLEKEAA